MDEISHPFPNTNGGTVPVWEWMNNVIPHFTGHAIIYPFYDQSQPVILKEAPGVVLSSRDDRMLLLNANVITNLDIPWSC